MVRIILLSGFLLAGIFSFAHNKANGTNRTAQLNTLTTLQQPGLEQQAISTSGTTAKELPPAPAEKAPETCVIKITMAGVTLTVTSNDCKFVIRSISRLDLVAAPPLDLDPVFRINRPTL